MRFLGRSDELPAAVQRDTHEAVDATAGNTGMVLCIALNYGGRAEIVDAANALLAERHAALDSRKLTESELERHLYTAGLPDPDLLIRTSGEMRVSNFTALADCLRARFLLRKRCGRILTARAFARSFRGFPKRDRRYGGIGESEATASASGTRSPGRLPPQELPRM